MINLYCNNPTAGKKDGTAISQDNTQTSPLALTLKLSEQKAVKVAIRTDAGYKTTDGVNISFAYYDGSEYQATGGNIANWYVCLDKQYATAEEALSKGIKSWFFENISLKIDKSLIRLPKGKRRHTLLMFKPKEGPQLLISQTLNR